ncbi:AAA family ATPase [Actinoplanes sp. TBRC 11911]|uniref:ATP-binding protein n=1 Tax=Actinoplanes sp. TBRC 11911 TaxID=2729386 RepID=UPI00145EBCB1|nr:helix-turn-helix transcriptional regulator [Actinoplanes sp. TBRC 11911]NMO54868.1 AAA family ATPase [Actinoplanes sp. TBRC 11911]
MAGLRGRDAELSQLSRLVAPAPTASHVRVLLGEPGIGKTALLSEVAWRAAAAGSRVLTVVGHESERDLAFAGLHQLVRPIRDRVPALPDRQARALLGALALTPDPVPPDALVTGIALLTLLSGLAADGPVLIVADDAQWLDRSSLDMLAFAARRLESEPLVLLVAARTDVLDRGFPSLTLPPIEATSAARLLDEQPDPPRGPARERVLAQAAGNPLALIELAKTIAAGRRLIDEPLPLTDRLTAAFSVRVDDLPAPTRAALVRLAVAGSVASPASLAPAERAGLIRVDAAGPRFTHPLVRAAVFHAVPFAERAAAHLRVASTLHDQPDRRAWHLAAAALEPDERVAALLEETAAQAQRRGGVAAAARAWERAADLSPAAADRVRRLLAAAGLAQSTGQADWVNDLATRVLASTGDPGLRLIARQRIGWAQVWSGRHAAALATLLAVAVEAAPASGWAALGVAATVAYQSGTLADRAAVLRTLDRMPSPDEHPEQLVWARACTEPLPAEDTVGSLRRIAAGPVTDAVMVGSAAWLLEETDLSIRLLREGLDRLRAPGLRGGSGGAMSSLMWACVDGGRWDEALAVAREAREAAAAYRMEPVAASAELCDAFLGALRGESLDTLPPTDTEYHSAAARAHHIAGLVAFTNGDVVGAYGKLLPLFGDDGSPLHHRVSYLAIADLAAAGVRAERTAEVRAVVSRALSRVSGTPLGPRLSQIASRARALLGASECYEEALADPAGETWPFERAQLRLDYGEWLRRRRRINDAKPVLAAALDTFRRLRAEPWAKRAEAELRACGVATTTAPDVLAELTSQQREIVLLAGRGLTNAEIADRLFLSPRTVASHLYRSYPKLGVAGRHQLRDLAETSRAE